MSARAALFLLALVACDPPPPAPPADAPCDQILEHRVMHECSRRFNSEPCHQVAWASFQVCMLERTGTVIQRPIAEMPWPQQPVTAPR